jgi:hypothetical protein
MKTARGLASGCGRSEGDEGSWFNLRPRRTGEGLTPALRLDLDEPQDDVAVALAVLRMVLSRSRNGRLDPDPLALLVGLGLVATLPRGRVEAIAS